MELKGLNKRWHNILFHTHTVAGITISAGLFVIFFAGAFALFREELIRWENPNYRYETPENIDFDRAMAAFIAHEPNIDLKNDMSIALPHDEHPNLMIYAYTKADSTVDRVDGEVNTVDYSITNKEGDVTTVGETLYDLHFFRQIPYVGMYISGFVALFFLFAIVTGVLIHWKDMLKKFYALKKSDNRKQFWKDAHVTFSFIGLPFQLIYGITGSLLGLSILLLLPSVMLLFGGDQLKVRGIIDPFFSIESPREAVDRTSEVSLNDIYAEFNKNYAEYEASFFRIKNYGMENAIMAINIDDKKTLTGDGTVVMDMVGGQELAAIFPENKVYGNAVFSLLIKLHYATFGGIWLKIIYFLLAMMTCFSIISGVLLWRHARDNKKYTDQQRLFHHRVTKISLAICYGLIPATAILFLANKLIPIDMGNRVFYVNTIFFLSWLILTIKGSFINSYSRIFRTMITITGIFALAIPISNGLFTGDWLWSTLASNQKYIAAVDIFWLVTAITCLIGLLGNNKRVNNKPVLEGDELILSK